jgi:hypothetical protein
MAKFQHVRTGKVIDVPDEDARRYRNARYIPLHQHQSAGQSWEPDQVPRGTVAEVLAWVGDDDLRRQSALTVERAGKKRLGIIEALRG